MFIVINKGKIFLYLIYFIVLSIICMGCYSIFLRQKSYASNQPKYLILVQIEEKKLFLFENKICIKEYPIASGKTGWPSPIGSWKIINKGSWGEGFGGRWLGLNVRWGKYGIHGTTRSSSIGSAASHGCIRMFNKDVIELYNIVPIGTPVLIKNGRFGVFGTGFRDLKPGDRGADVLAVQRKLKELDYFKGYESGIYEEDLKKALYKFQKDNNLTVKHTITRVDYNAMGFMEFE